MMNASKKVIYFFLFFLSILANKLLANPQGESIQAGNVLIDQLDKLNMRVFANDKDIINWKSFSIAENEITTFLQTSINSTVLNRVVGFDSSCIFGKLKANGQLFLINPNGILIGKNGFINTSSFVASTLNITDEDFVNSKGLLFKSSSNESILNYGIIKTSDGDISLLGTIVENYGFLEATNGKVSIAACNEVLLQIDRNQNFFIRVKNEKNSDNAILNEGDILAIQAELVSGRNLYDYAIKNSGSISAFGLEQREGHVFLIAEEGKNIVTGNVLAKNENESGGKIQILGDKVGIFENANIDVSSDFGNGEILIGGGFQGKNPEIKNAIYTYIYW